MNANAKAWVEALRSDQFPQTKNFLQANGAFCCLGVACELAIADGITVSKRLRYSSEREHAETYEYEGLTGYLPDAVQRWLDLTTDNGAYSYEDDNGTHQYSLTDLNDNGKTFAEIADLIESKPKGLFWR